MFDNLRESADSSFYEEEPNDLYKEPILEPSKPASMFAAPRPARANNARMFGLTAQQRFFLTFMLFLAVCMMGTLAMFVLGKMGI